MAGQGAGELPKILKKPEEDKYIHEQICEQMESKMPWLNNIIKESKEKAPIGSFSDFRSGSKGNIFRDIDLGDDLTEQERFDFKNEDTHLNLTYKLPDFEPFKEFSEHKIDLPGFPYLFKKKKDKIPLWVKNLKRK